ncbi:N-alpha-acetyltransferase 35: NatC auxiliary subunit-like protein [Leptotrombidium deliense]|uniref:Protein MAK10 homolog n=1 Tax=Leptotrombidium deliense TaxID=299467 RepID=A0A443STU0_9ACAR|nr:N-alpha-acetyltransferase 35: NatC auxiliary subunit-like protein [Leptotrombidium deliense]
MENNSDPTFTEPQFKWKDVTKGFKAASEQLKLGELLHDDTFGLFEAMSAIEMMDPKMDAGMVCNRNKKVLNFEQAVACGKLKVNDVKLEEKIGIIDDTCGCLITWLEGHSLAQTVFTNLYLHNPNAVEDKCIRAFSVVILKLVAIIKEFVTKANVVEEEDFQPLYGFVMACDYSDNKSCAMIRDVEEEIQRKIKSIEKCSSKQFVKDENDETFNQEKEHQLLVALCVRLKFFKLLFQSLVLLKKEIFNKVQCKKSIVSTNVDDIEKNLQLSSELFSIWHKTLSMGIQPEINGENDSRGDYPTIMGFEPLVNQRLLPPTFPRRILMKTRKEAVEYLECLVNRLRHICKVYECSTFHSALDFFTDFSKASTPSCVLSRSILQLLYLPVAGSVFGAQPLSELLRETLRQFIKPPSLQAKSLIFVSNFQAKEYVEVFFSHCTRPMTLLLQISGHNRARQREKLAQVLEEFATLQDEAEKLDAFLNNISQKLDTPFSHMGYFSTWILYHILRIMIQYLISGFELELYATHEYPYIFWYLYEFLFGWMVSTLNRATNLIMEQESQSETQKGRNSKKSKTKRRKQKPHIRETMLNQALQQLCGGYYKTVCAFKLQGKLKMPKAGLNSDQIRHEHRFSAFHSVIAPPPVSYNQFKEMTDQMNRQNPNDLYVTACKCFHQAKTLLETIPEPNEEICSLMKIAKTNYVVIKLLLSGNMKDSKASDEMRLITRNKKFTYPEFDFSVNNNFPIIRVL